MLTGLVQYMLSFNRYMYALDACALVCSIDALVYTIEGGHQWIKFRLSIYAYTHSC